MVDNKVNLDEDLNLFDEDDWDFLKVNDGTSIRDFDYFSDIRDSEFFYKEPSKYKIVFQGFGVAFLVGCAILVMVAIFWGTIGKSLSTDKDVENVAETSEDVGLTYVDGNNVDDDVTIGISGVFNDYISELNSGSFNDLYGLCLNNDSSFASTEKAYRENIKYSYDSNDCYARALRKFAEFVSIQRVNKVIEKDDCYYCYITLQAPDVGGLYEYYVKYSADMNKYFNVNELNNINVTSYILSTVSNGDLPLTQTEYLFIVQEVDGVYKITSDTQIQSMCTNAYTESVNQVISILGGKLINTQYKGD